MASLNQRGFDELLAQLAREGDRIQTRGDAALNAAADIVVEAQKAAAPKRSGDGHGHDTHLSDAITKSAVKSGGMGDRVIDVYPDGVREDGERYATVAFVLEYGRSDMPARPWMRTTMAKNKTRILQTMKDVLLND